MGSTRSRLPVAPRPPRSPNGAARTPAVDNAPREARPLPKLALTAFAMQQQDNARIREMIGQEALQAMGLKASDGWHVFPEQGVAIHDPVRPIRPAATPPKKEEKNGKHPS